MTPIHSVLFADVSDWTTMCERLGNENAKTLVDGLFDELAPVVAEHRGRVIKRIDDELMCLFSGSGSAGRAARAMQRAAERRNRTAKVAVYLRIGFQSGPVLVQDNDCHGDTVNTAKRIADLAARGCILSSRQTASQFPPDLARDTRNLPSAALNGKEAAVGLVEIEWHKGDDDDTDQPTERPLPRVRRLVLTCQREVRTLEAGGGSLKFGRMGDNDLVITDPRPRSLISGRHGHFEWRGGAIALVDTSRNGIYVSFRGQRAFKIESGKPLQLRASGRLALGQSFETTGVIVAEFTLE